jgi:TPR repeat protein
VDAVDQSFNQRAIVNLSKTVGVCVTVVGLVVSGCSAAPETEFERTLKIAKTGDDAAQNNLGFMYDNGRGVPQDHVEAYAWLSVAAVGGDADAAKYRDIVKESLSGSQLAQGQRRATELFEEHGSK